MLVSEPNESMVPVDTASMLPTRIDIASPLRIDSASPPRTDLALLLPGERVRLDLPPLTPTGARPGQLLRPEQIERNALLAQGELVTLTIRSGDTLDRLFRRNDLSIGNLAEMVALPEGGRNLAKINPGDKIEVIRDGQSVLALSRDISQSQRLWIKRDGEGYVAEVIDLEMEVRSAGVHGEVESTLWEAAIDAGLDSAVIDLLARTFEWNIDFSQEVRSGDSFTVVYEEFWRDGVRLRTGDIIAAEYVNRGKSYRAARYVDAEGVSDLFTPEGVNVERAFLRYPVDFTRISSNFNPNRRHPILNTIRAHRGVDLAAATGTEIYAAGDGKIIARGANGSYGNRIEIQHGGGITTLYAHLNSFGRFRVGDRVEQGEVIGYVGMTGGATGPHLHYEYRVNGVHQNPRTVDLPEAEPIAREYLADFQASTASLWHQLDLYQGSLLAQNDN